MSQFSLLKFWFLLQLLPVNTRDSSICKNLYLHNLFRKKEWEGTVFFFYFGHPENLINKCPISCIFHTSFLKSSATIKSHFWNSVWWAANFPSGDICKNVFFARSGNFFPELEIFFESWIENGFLKNEIIKRDFERTIKNANDGIHWRKDESRI